MGGEAYPHGDTAWLEKDRFGMFIHWGSYALGARHEWLKRNERIADGDYDRFFEHFEPDLYDPRKWARAAREAGMKYFVVTAKHHEGFCLWDTAHTDYKATRTPWGKDVLAPMVDAFREEGLKVGFYYSLLDWHHPDYPVDRHHPRAEDAEFRKRNAGRDVRKYAAYMRAQVEELLTRFGPIDVLWFDFSFPGDDGKGRDDWESERMLELVRRLAPRIVLNDRLDLPGSADVVTPEQVQPDGPVTDETGRSVLWEACQTFSGSWGYHRDEKTWKSVAQVLWMLIDGVSKGGNLLLNVGPNARGEIDDRAMSRLEGVGRWMRVNGRSIHGCGPAPAEFVCPPDCRYTWNPETRRLYLHVLNWPIGGISVKGMEDKIEYAQLLHDASEVRIGTTGVGAYSGAKVLRLPVVKPDVEVPVVELFLKT